MVPRLQICRNGSVDTPSSSNRGRFNSVGRFCAASIPSMCVTLQTSHRPVLKSHQCALTSSNRKVVKRWCWCDGAIMRVFPSTRTTSRSPSPCSSRASVSSSSDSKIRLPNSPASFCDSSSSSSLSVSVYSSLSHRLSGEIPPPLPPSSFLSLF